MGKVMHTNAYTEKEYDEHVKDVRNSDVQKRLYADKGKILLNLVPERSRHNTTDRPYYKHTVKEKVEHSSGSQLFV